ncbi:MAG: hypothetical protein WA828_10085 [Coleofasciculaceae cyanobacterium]
MAAQTIHKPLDWHQRTIHHRQRLTWHQALYQKKPANSDRYRNKNPGHRYPGQNDDDSLVILILS